jgi:O-antigen ligase
MVSSDDSQVDALVIRGPIPLMLTSNLLKDAMGKAVRGPALPLALLVNGSFFYFAGFYALDLKPFSYLTGCYYILLIFWALVLLVREAKGKLLFRIHAVDVLFSLFVAIVLGSILLHGVQGHSKQLLYILVLVVLPYFCGRVCRLDNVMPFMVAIIATSIAGLLFAVFNTVAEPKVVLSWVRPVFFGFNHTTLLLGFLLGTLIVLAVVHLLFEKNNEPLSVRVIAWCTIAVSLFSLIFIACRGALLAGLVTSLLFIIMAYWVSWRRRLLIAFGLAALTVTAYGVMPKPAAQMRQALLPVLEVRSEKFINCNQIKNSQNSAEIRLFLWGEAVRFFKESPFIGIGAGRFGDRSCLKNGFPHSPLIQAFAELGLVGGALFLAYIGVIFCGLLSIIRNSQFDEMERRLVSYVFALWFLYLLISNLYGDYFRDTSFSLSSGIAVAIIAGFRKKESVNG